MHPQDDIRQVAVGCTSNIRQTVVGYENCRIFEVHTTAIKLVSDSLGDMLVDTYVAQYPRRLALVTREEGKGHTPNGNLD